jgi:hypothetical protein
MSSKAERVVIEFKDVTIQAFNPCEKESDIIMCHGLLTKDFVVNFSSDTWAKNQSQTLYSGWLILVLVDQGMLELIVKEIFLSSQANDCLQSRRGRILHCTDRSSLGLFMTVW